MDPNYFVRYLIPLFVLLNTVYSVHRWMSLYRLYTDQHQQYFWCFILCIVTQIKYVDIEFENQMVLIPLINANWDKKPQINVMDRLMAGQEVQGELHDAAFFEGTIIPPTQEWHYVSKISAIKDIGQKISKCGILHRAEKDIGDEKMTEKEYRWIIDQGDYEKFQFNQDETSLLRLIDCIRVFVLEYEKGVINAFWPLSKTLLYSFTINND